MIFILCAVFSSICSSIPAYKSSVFSRITTISTLSNLVLTAGIFLQGRTFAYKFKSFLNWTFTERNPLPIGVVIGAFNATLFSFIESSTRWGNGTPSFSITSNPAVWISHSIGTFASFMILTTASEISGPIPSPLINVTFVIISP